MEKRIFDTLIKKGHKLGENSYVIGRVAGMLEAICHWDNDGFAEPELNLWHVPGKGDIMTAYCTPERYESFKNLVEKWYPGMCEFDTDLIKQEELD